MEFSEGIGIRDLTVNKNEVLVLWKWAWEDSPPMSKSDSDTRSESSPQCEEDEPAEGEALDTEETSGDSVTNHTVVFKVMGTVKEARYEKVLEKIAPLLDEGRSVPVRMRPEPNNPYDSKAMLFECELEHEWRAVGYVVRDALDAVHDALDKKQITEVKFDWVKYIVHFKRSRPGWYAGIKITKQGKWPKEVIQCATTVFR